MRILLVDEEMNNAKAIGDFLVAKGYQTDIAGNFKDSHYYIGIRNYNLIILSLGLGGDVFDLLENVRIKMPKTKIIVLSHKFPNIDGELKSFKNGADDFIYKPLNPSALLARIQTRLKLAHSNIIGFGDLAINPDEERIIYKNKEVNVKGKPFEVLTHLARHYDEIISKEQLLDSIWEEPELVTPNVIEVAINQIRQKIDKPLGIRTIETIRRRGYRFCYDSATTSSS